MKRHLIKSNVNNVMNTDIHTFVEDHKDWLKSTLDNWADQFHDDAQLQGELFESIN